MPDSIHIAIALEGVGAHPAAWREDSARPHEVLTPGYWADLVGSAERAAIDLVTVDDSFVASQSVPGESRTDLVTGHLDATLIAARVAPTTRFVGLVPTAVTTHTEPFHLSKAVATVDHVSRGRAGVLLRPSDRADEARLFGRRAVTDLSPADHREELGDYVEVLRRLWDSWEDDAEIRDVATGRFVDREKLHYADFEGRFFSVRGPSITPRPPQGQPIIALRADGVADHQLIGTAADVAFVDARSADDLRGAIDGIETARIDAGRTEPVRVLVDLTVFLADTTDAAAARKRRLDDRAPVDVVAAEGADGAEVFVGTVGDLADRIAELADTGASGVRLRPGVIPDDLDAITTELIPELRRRTLFRTDYAESTLRERLGLGTAVNRYALGGTK